MRCLILLLLLSLNGLAIADERFYTTVDAQGHIQVIKSKEDALVDKKASELSTEKTAPQTKDTAAVKSELTTDAKATKSEPTTYQIGTETYVDSEFLEKKDFNLDDKKRFYYLPDGSIGSQVVETKAGVVSAPKASPTVTAKPISFLASAYQSMTNAELKSMYPADQVCFSQKYLTKHAKPFKPSNDVWVRQALTQDKFEPDVILNMSSLAASNISTLRFVSFASSHKKPKFYLPVIVFLDKSGCPLSGAWQYWSQAHAASEKQFASVDGLLTIPEHSAYLLAYRSADTLKADIPSTRESGSFVVETY